MLLKGPPEAFVFGLALGGEPEAVPPAAAERSVPTRGTRSGQASTRLRAYESNK